MACKGARAEAGKHGAWAECQQDREGSGSGRGIKLDVRREAKSTSIPANTSNRTVQATLQHTSIGLNPLGVQDRPSSSQEPFYSAPHILTPGDRGMRASRVALALECILRWRLKLCVAIMCTLMAADGGWVDGRIAPLARTGLRPAGWLIKGEKASANNQRL